MAQVIVRSEREGEMQGLQYTKIKASVMSISNENESLKAKGFLLENENIKLKAELGAIHVRF